MNFFEFMKIFEFFAKKNSKEVESLFQVKKNVHETQEVREYF
jgi:hypothetical protein